MTLLPTMTLQMTTIKVVVCGGGAVVGSMSRSDRGWRFISLCSGEEAPHLDRDFNQGLQDKWPSY